MNSTLMKETLKEFQQRFGVEKSENLWKQCYYNAERSFYNKLKYRLDKAEIKKEVK